jgi:hypothetical protein
VALVMPVKTGIQEGMYVFWTPAFAGVTNR